jgi:hypothetical protein
MYTDGGTGSCECHLPDRKLGVMQRGKDRGWIGLIVYKFNSMRKRIWDSLSRHQSRIGSDQLRALPRAPGGHRRWWRPSRSPARPPWGSSAHSSHRCSAAAPAIKEPAQWDVSTMGGLLVSNDRGAPLVVTGALGDLEYEPYDHCGTGWRGRGGRTSSLVSVTVMAREVRLLPAGPRR